MKCGLIPGPGFALQVQPGTLLEVTGDTSHDEGRNAILKASLSFCEEDNT